MPLPPILTLDIAHLTQVLSPAVFWELGSDAQVVTLNDAILCIESNDLDP